MVLPLIVAAVLTAVSAGAVIGIAIAVARITYTLIMDFFLRFRNRIRSNPDLKAITVDVNRAIATGGAKVIQAGLFDTRQQEFVESTAYESTSVDSEVSAAHRNHQVVIWQ
jgi:hypothetical protein